VRVTEWRFKPGAETGHRHEADHVVVPLGDGHLSYDQARQRRAPMQDTDDDDRLVGDSEEQAAPFRANAHEEFRGLWPANR
jgi:hypothetical protein